MLIKWLIVLGSQIAIERDRACRQCLHAVERRSSVAMCLNVDGHADQPGRGREQVSVGGLLSRIAEFAEVLPSATADLRVVSRRNVLWSACACLSAGSPYKVIERTSSV